MESALGLSKQQIRQLIKRQRIILDADQRHQAEQALLQNILASNYYQQAEHIAFYKAHNGEISLDTCLQQALQDGKKCYLPILCPTNHGHLVFQQYTKDTPLFSNRFGIPEPTFDANTLLAPQFLDLIFVPLVAFGQQCHRIGMGAGYYDKTLAFILSKPATCPWLVGIAFDWQYLENLPQDNWDIPLTAIITDKVTIIAQA